MAVNDAGPKRGRAPRSDAERLARTRLLIAAVAVYLLSVGFMALGDRVYQGTPYLPFSRLAVFPFFLLLTLRLARLVRVRPPVGLWEARQLLAAGKPDAARGRFLRVLAEDADSPAASRVLRARRLLHDGLAVSVAQEARLEAARCSLLLGQTEQATRELAPLAEELPARADVAIELADALSRHHQEAQAAEVLRRARPQMDALDLMGLRQQPQLAELLEAGELAERRSGPLAAKLLRERCLAGVLLGLAVLHALHLYLGLF